MISLTITDPGEIIKILIMRKYITQDQAAADVGCSNSFISRVAKGKQLPSEKLLNHFGMTRVDGEVFYR